MKQYAIGKYPVTLKDTLGHQLIDVSWGFTSHSTHKKSSAAAEMGDRLVTIDMGQESGEGAAVSLSVGWVPI